LEELSSLMLEPLHVVGISHKTAPLPVLEKLALSAGEQADLLGALGADALVLSTCNRTEFYRYGDFVDVADLTGIERERLPDAAHFYRYQGRSALSHLFRVACGIDSAILGENQILGQLRTAFSVCASQNVLFRTLLDAALRAGATARRETEIATGAVSMASAAVHLAARIHGERRGRKVVVVGAGDTGRLLAEHFAASHPASLIVVNRTLERAAAVAALVGGTAAPLDALREQVYGADVIALATASREPLLHRQDVQSHSPLVVLDLGLPRNADPDLHQAANVFLHDLDSLKKVVDQSLARRRQEVPRVEALIDREIDRLLAARRVQDVAPLLRGIRANIEQVRLQEMARVDLSDSERAAVDQVTRTIANKLAHGPLAAIKRLARAQEAGAQELEIIRALFAGLDQKQDRAEKS
jgi:glutamyl-tRNA reductase